MHRPVEYRTVPLVNIFICICAHRSNIGTLWFLLMISLGLPSTVRRDHQSYAKHLAFEAGNRAHCMQHGAFDSNGLEP